MTNSLKRMSGALFFVALILFFSCQSSNKKVEILTLDKDTLNGRPLLSEFDTFYLGERLVKVQKIEEFDFNGIKSGGLKSDTSEIKNLKRDSVFVKRRGDTLIFETLEKQVVLVNVNDEENEADFGSYSYLGINNALDQFVVFGSYYEGSDHILIDKKTGDKTNIPGIPIASPDKKLFISGNVDLQAGFDFNGINLYSNSHPPTLIESKPLTTWGPQEIRWKEDSIILVKARVSDTTTDNLERIDYFKLIFKQ
jgi:hypothetical protein